jgi:hypothetical protein
MCFFNDKSNQYLPHASGDVYATATQTKGFKDFAEARMDKETIPFMHSPHRNKLHCVFLPKRNGIG